MATINIEKIFWIRDLMSNFREMTLQWLQKKFQSFKIWTYYIHIEARDLEISHM